MNGVKIFHSGNGFTQRNVKSYIEGQQDINKRIDGTRKGESKISRQELSGWLVAISHWWC